MSSLKGYFRRKLYRDQWFIAWRLNEKPVDLKSKLDELRILRPPRDRYWADPFPVCEGMSYWLFFEEFCRQSKRGRIVVSRLLDDGSWEIPRVALERPYHLSYPCVFRWQGQWLMTPESAANRTIELWRCVDFPDRWEHDCTLFKGVTATDSTCVEIDGRFWLFTCMAQAGERAYRDLFVFPASNPRGPWIAHRKNPVVSDTRWARPAGHLFVSGGVWHRPAQDCASVYGRRMTVRAIRKLTPAEYAEEELFAIDPDWAPGLLATHTLNVAGNLTVVDGCARRAKFW